MQIKIQTRSGKDLVKLSASKETLVKELNEKIHKKFPKYYPERQRLSYVGSDSGKNKKGSTLEQEKTLSHYGIQDGDVIIFKDLGPQIGWRTVFLVEYAGPALIHPLFFYYGKYIYGTDIKYGLLQQTLMWLNVLHFAKRLLETIFVHRFSHATMPIMNIFKNSFHYWVLSGVLFAGEIYSPWYSRKVSQWTFGQLEYVLVLIWIWAELSNLSTHITLKNLRPPGTKKRAIPFGYGFDAPFSISCPNYFFETIAWLVVLFLSQSYACGIFFVAAVYQMFVWALKKHQNYRKEFKNYPKNRKAMFPFIA